MKFEKPELIIIEFNLDDVILTSLNSETDIDGDGIPDTIIP